jgi:peptidoglycan/LPS O-acetylase OafA/YrhL
MSDSRSTRPASGIALQSAGNHQPAQRLGHRPALDGVRGIAVLLVIAVHVGLLDSGDIGVDVFFPLSGFLITALLYEEWERYGALSLRRFYARRARRLLPALTMLVVAFAVLSQLVHTFSATCPRGTLIGSTLLFANNWVATLSPAHGRALGPLSPTWSLAQEGQFYLLWPAVLATLLRWRRRTSFVLGVLGVSILVLVAAVPLVRHAYPVYGAYTSPLDRSAELLLGSGAAILWRERLLPSLLERPITGWLALTGLVLVLAQGTTPRRATYMFAAVLTTLLIVSLLTGGRTGTVSDSSARRLAGRVGGALSAALGSAPLRSTGRISYGIYLYHLPTYYLVLNYAPDRSHYFYGAVVLAASLLAAACSWKLVESPIVHGIAPEWRIVARVSRGYHDRDPAPVVDAPVAASAQGTYRRGAMALQLTDDVAAVDVDDGPCGVRSAPANNSCHRTRSAPACATSTANPSALRSAK